MKQKLLLKTMLLLCALIAGSSSVWADDPITGTLDMTKSQTSPVVNNGVTFTWSSEYIVTGASSATSNGFCGKNGTADMTITIPSGKRLVGISKTNGSNWGSTNINVYTGTNNSGTLVAEISQGTNTYSITSNNTGTTYYLVTSASKNAWLKSLSITYEDNSTVSTPSISGETPFLTSTEVSISCGTDGAAIQYSLDNGSSWTNYTVPFTLTETKTVKAKATKSGMTDSNEASKTFTKVTPLTVADALTAINALADNGTIADQYVAGKISQIDSYSSNTITYWISDDGTTTSQLEVYKGKGLKGANFSAESDLTVGDEVVVFGTLKKYVSGTTTTPEFNSNSELISYIPKVKAPTFSPAAGAVAAGTEITINTATDGATIYYTTDGTNPTTESSVYSAPISIDAAKTIKAFAVKDGHPDSDVATAAYTIAEPCATPTFSVAAGTYTSVQSVELACATDGATIYYTTNGYDPTTASTEYTAAITVDETMTIKAIAVKDGLANSAIASAAYTINLPDYVTLPFSWAGGTSSDLTAIPGVTGNSLGDYASANAPYRIQMNAVGDYIQIKTNAQLGKVSVGVKMIGGGTTSKIKVQESADGSTFTDVEEFTISGSQNDILNFATTTAFKAVSRYVRIIKSEHASGGNIGVGPISIAIPEAPEPTTSGDEVYLTTTDNMEGWRTFFDASQAYTVDANTTVYAAQTAAGKINLVSFTGGIPAGTPVVLHTSSAADSHKMTLTKAGSVTASVPTNILRATTTTTDLSAGTYRLGYKSTNGVGFYNYASATAPAGIVYILKSDVTGGAPGFVDFEIGDGDTEGDATGIEAIENGTLNIENDVVFDLQGRKVLNPTKGLYIVNGRKVIVK